MGRSAIRGLRALIRRLYVPDQSSWLISVVSEFGYGIALITESKYGYAVQGNVMRLSLLRSPLRPDPECDRGKQVFSFSILPHTGTCTESPVAEVAYSFNSPLSGTSSARVRADVSTSGGRHDGACCFGSGDAFQRRGTAGSHP